MDNAQLTDRKDESSQAFAFTASRNLVPSTKDPFDFYSSSVDLVL